MGFDLKQAIASAAPGARLDVPAGTWAGGLTLDKPITLVGHGTARFDGLSRGPILTVRARDVVLEGFTFTNAVALAGAAVSFHEGTLTLRDCLFERCLAPTHGGGALYARGDSLLIDHCRFVENTGRAGGAVLLDQLVEATVRQSLFLRNRAVRGGALRLKEGASAVVDRCTFVENTSVVDPPMASTIDVAGTKTRTPRLELKQSAWIGSSPLELGRADQFPGEVVLTRNALPPSLAGLGGENRFEALEWFEERLKISTSALGALGAVGAD